MTVKVDQKTEWGKTIDSYYNPGNERSFFQYRARLERIAKKTDDLRNEILSQGLNRRSAESDFMTFKTFVSEIRQLEVDLCPANLLCTDAYSAAKDDKGTFCGDYFSFLHVLDNLSFDISKAYADSLYPLLQVIRDAKRGWEPSGWICRVWDYVDWVRVKDPREEICKEFPTPPRD